MKKTLLKLLLVTALFTLFFNNSFAASDCPGKKDPDCCSEEVAMRDATDPVDPFQERSAFPTCQAFITGNKAEICFNKYIGTAYVYIVNQMGSVVSSVDCDTEFQFSANLPISTSKGMYRICIISSTGYQAEGNFSIN